MQKKYLSLLFTIMPTVLFGTGSSPEASLDDGVKHKISVKGTLVLNAKQNDPKSVTHITLGGQIMGIRLPDRPEQVGANGAQNYTINIPDPTKVYKKEYILNINPNDSYGRIDLVSKDPQGNIRIETVEIQVPEPDSVWIFRNGPRRFEYTEIIVISNVGGRKRHHLVERNKEIICDEEEAAGEIRRGAKIAAVKSLKINGFKIEHDKNETPRTKKMSTAKKNASKNRSVKIQSASIKA